MSISVTVSGEDSTSIILTQPQTGLISISGDQFIDVTAFSGDSATVIVSSGDPITITGNYSNYATGDVVRPPEISDFLTENQINSKIITATGDYNTLATNSFYPKSNPSGYITGVDLSDYVEKSETGAFYASSNPSGYITGVDLSAYTTEEFVTGVSGYLQGQISSNDSEITEIVNSTGSFALKSETGSFISESQTGQFYAASNPSGFITGVDLSSYVQDSETGAFYASSNPSGFITGVDLSSYVQNSETGLFLVSGEDAVVNNLTTSGNVGIGTDTSSAKLEIAGSATSTIGVINATNTNFINGTDTPTINARFPTNNASTFGSMSMGKYGTSNNGVGLRFQQVEGTDRLIFRGSSSAGAMVWSQPEASAQLLMDYSNNRSFRFTDDLFTPMRASVNLGGNTSSTRWDNLYANNGYFNNALNVNSLFVVDSSGNVGIGQTNPAAPLSVNGNVLVNTNNPDVDGTPLVVRGNTDFHGIAIKSPRSPRIYFDEGADGSETELAFFGIQDTDNAFVMRNWGGSSNDLLFAVQGGGGRAAAASSEALQLFHNGQMTLNAAWTAGITDSQLYMHVPSASTKGITVDGAVGQTANLQEWKVNGTALSVVDSDGNVGIGTDTPNYKLDVNGQINAYSSTYPVLKFTRETSTAGTNGDFSDAQGIASAMQLITKSTNNITDGFGGGIVFSILDNTFSNETQPIARIYARRDGADNRGALQFFTQGSSSITPSMIIRNNGNVGIGTSSPTEKLEVSGNILATSGDVSAQLSVLQDNTSFPRAGFKINSNVSATNYGFSIRNNSSSDSTTFLEIVNAEDYSASTARAFIMQSPTALTIRSAKDNGNVAGTPIVFSTKGNQDAAITIPSDSTNVNFPGNVGIGTSSPDELLHLEATSQSLTREVLMKATVSDAGNDQFGIANGTSTNSNFAPSFYGYKDSNYGNGYIYSMNFRGLVPSSQDTTQTNRFGVIHFEAFKSSSATDPNNNLDGGVSNRKVLTVANGSDTLVNIEANGNVGIGTSSPTEKLEVSGDLMLQQNGVIKNKNNNTQFRFGVNDLYLDSGHLRAGYSVGIRGNRGSTKGMEQGSTRNSDLGLYCASIEAVSIRNNGNVDANYNFTINQDLSVSGDSSFSNRPTVNGTGVLLSGEGGGGTVANVVHTTGDQTISGTKSFGKISLSENSFVTETGSFTMGSIHRGATVLLQNSAPMTVTIPAQVSGHTTTFIAETSNSVVFATGAGISGFNSFNSANQIAGIYGQAQIIFKSPEYAFLGGNVV